MKKLNNKQELQFKEWQELSLSCLSGGYKYNNEKADIIVELQHSGKRQEEKECLKRMLPDSTETVFLDYGCGEGWVAEVLYEKYALSIPFVVNVDLDQDRLEVSNEIYKELGLRSVQINSSFDRDIEMNSSLRSSLSFIMCIQVLGHVSPEAFGIILGKFRDLLSNNGSLIIALPVIGKNFEYDGLEHGEDLFHLVDFSLSPLDPGFRRRVKQDEFAELSVSPESDLLPVHAFYIDSKIEKSELNGAKLNNKSIAENFNKYGFEIDEMKLYSVHESGMGDIMMKLSPLKKYETIVL